MKLPKLLKKLVPKKQHKAKQESQDLTLQEMKDGNTEARSEESTTNVQISESLSRENRSEEARSPIEQIPEVVPEKRKHKKRHHKKTREREPTEDELRENVLGLCNQLESNLKELSREDLTRLVTELGATIKGGLQLPEPSTSNTKLNRGGGFFYGGF